MYGCMQLQGPAKGLQAVRGGAAPTGGGFEVEESLPREKRSMFFFFGEPKKRLEFIQILGGVAQTL